MPLRKFLTSELSLKSVLSVKKEYGCKCLETSGLSRGRVFKSHMRFRHWHSISKSEIETVQYLLSHEQPTKPPCLDIKCGPMVLHCRERKQRKNRHRDHLFLRLDKSYDWGKV